MTSTPPPPPSSSESEPSADYQLQPQESGEVEIRPFYPPWSDFYDDEANKHPEYFMSEQEYQRLQADKTLSDHDIMVIQHLAMRKFHVPGNSYWEDYYKWFGNNHPFFCFCFADPRHPLGRHERIMNLVASLAFGLAATCSVVLWFFYEDADFHRTVFSLPGGLNVSIGMIVLLIFGGPLHVIFDLGLYFLQSCPPCRAGGIAGKYLPESQQKCWLWLGAHVAFFITIASLTLAINVMLIRASINDDGDDEDIAKEVEHYSFLGLYCIEVFIANFVVFPLGTFTMFSGVLGCGVVPGIGGRPYQVKKWERTQERKRKRKEKRERQQELESKVKEQQEQGLSAVA